MLLKRKKFTEEADGERMPGGAPTQWALRFYWEWGQDITGAVAKGL